MRFTIAQAAQERLPGGTLGLFGVEAVDGVLAARVGLATPAGRLKLRIRVGETVTVDALGTLSVLDIRLGEQDAVDRVLFEFLPKHTEAP